MSLDLLALRAGLGAAALGLLLPDVGNPLMRRENPKDIAALDRLPLWSLPAIGPIHGAMATADGAEKYGPYNWREQPICLMEYIGALERHLQCLKDGAWYTLDSPMQDFKVTHLGCIIAGASIVLDAEQCGTLKDDRPTPGGKADLFMEQYKRARREQRAGKAGNTGRWSRFKAWIREYGTLGESSE